VSRAAQLADRLGLTDDELCAVLEARPLELIGDELDHRPELGILLSLTAEAHERVGDEVLRRWVRSAGPAGRPLDHLMARDFPAFERAVETLLERGFVLGRG
jgi:hypothetical protein